MPRTARAAVGGSVYHVLNRGNGRMGIFRKPADYQAFLTLLIDGKRQAEIATFSWRHHFTHARFRDAGQRAFHRGVGGWVPN